MRECGEEFLQRGSLWSQQGVIHLHLSLSEIITAFPIKPLSLSVFSSVYYTGFYSIFNSSLSHLSFQPSSSLQWFQHHSFSRLFWLILQSSLSPAIRPLFPPLLYCYFFPFLPSILPTLWQPGLVRCRLREPRIHVVQGRRWGTWGMGPLAKTTSPAVA